MNYKIIIKKVKNNKKKVDKLLFFKIICLAFFVHLFFNEYLRRSGREVEGGGLENR